MKNWISNGAEYSFHMQLIDIYNILNKFLIVNKLVVPKIEELHKELEEYTVHEDSFNRISGEIYKLTNLIDISVYKIYTIIDVAKMLMCIDLEMRINKFCYYNLNDDVFEAIEKLDISKKLIVAIYSVDNSKFKGTKQYEYVNSFKGFRNSYAHGKVQEIIIKEKNQEEIQKKKLRCNRISKCNSEILFEKSLLDQINELMKFCGEYIILINYLNDLNKFKAVEIFDLSQLEDIKYYIDLIKIQINIIENDLELDSETRGVLEYLLDKQLNGFEI